MDWPEDGASLDATPANTPELLVHVFQLCNGLMEENTSSAGPSESDFGTPLLPAAAFPPACYDGRHIYLAHPLKAHLRAQRLSLWVVRLLER